MPIFPGFIGDAYKAASVYQDAQELENWYPEVDIRKSPGERGVLAFYPTPAMKFSTDIPVSNGPTRGMFVLPNGGLLVVQGSFVSFVSATNAVSVVLGLATSTGPISITCNGLSAFITDGVNRYSYVLATNVAAILTDGPWVGGVNCDIIDNYIVYNQPGNSKQWAATDALATTTPALSVASTLSSYDPLVAVFVDQRQVALLGQYVSEWWSDTGAFPFPFSIVPGTTRQYGCAAPYTVQRFSNGFCMVGQDKLGQGIVFYVEGYAFNRISTHAIEDSLKGKVISDAFAFTYQQGGHVFYVVNFPTANLTWVYDLTTQMWHKRTSYNQVTGNFEYWRATCVISYRNKIYVGDRLNGIIYELSNTQGWDDYNNKSPGGFLPYLNPQPIRRLRQATHLTENLQEEHWSELQAQFQPGVGFIPPSSAEAEFPANNPSFPPSAQDPGAVLSWSNDGGSTFTTEKFRKIGKSGQYKNRCIWRRLGMARDRIYRLYTTDPVNNVLISVQLQQDDEDDEST